MPVTIVIPDDVVEYIILQLMYNYPEAGRDRALCCTDFNYKKLEFSFIDYEEADKEHPGGKPHTVTKEKLIKAFELMLVPGKWPKGLTQPICGTTKEQWERFLDQTDANDCDALVQLACFGEVLYG
jgi:hypothetical protein